MDDLAFSVSLDSPVREELPRWRVFWLTIYLGTLAGLGPLAIDMYLPAFPRIAQAFGVGVPDVQKTLASYFIGLAVGQLFYGPLADRLGRKPALFLGLGLFALASLGCATARSVGALAALRFIQALGGCAEMVMSRAIVRDLFDDRQSTKVFSSLVLVMGVAPILAPMLGAFLSVHLGWSSIFWAHTAAGIGGLLSTAFFFRESLPPARRIRQTVSEIIATYFELLTHREFMLQAMTVSIGMAALFAYVGGSPYVFEKIFHITEGHFGFYFGPIAVGIIGMSQVNGRLANHFDIRAILRNALVVGAIAGVILIIDAMTSFGGFWGIYIPLWMFMASMGFVFPNTTVLAMSPHGRIAGNASAVLGFLQFGVSAVGGLLVSAWQGAQTSPTPIPMAATIAICMAAALVINLCTHTGPTHPEPSDEAEGSVMVAEHS
jgi:DHA1 family bicyclomycin/chloramphenicol resistance-like MFS transporter